jgi:ATP-dependent Clp protease ATP-binding subunit ClpA
MSSAKGSTPITSHELASGNEPAEESTSAIRTGPWRILYSGRKDQQIRKGVRPLASVASGNQARALAISASPLVGREREIDAISDLISQPTVRLLTLTGPGGVGKTRLAQRIAETVAEHLPDGVWFVPLASIRDPDLVLSAIAQVLDVRETGHRSPWRESRMSSMRRMPS